MVPRIFGVLGGGANWSPVGDHAAAHGLVRISVVRGVAGHGHGPVFHVPLRNDPALCCGPSRVLLGVLSMSECVGRGLLRVIWLRRRLLVHLRPGVAS
jgi:hypothetical protein